MEKLEAAAEEIDGHALDDAQPTMRGERGEEVAREQALVLGLERQHEHEQVHRRGDRGAEREAEVAERTEGREVPAEVREHGDHAAREGHRPRAPERVERGRHHLDGRIGGEAFSDVPGERARRLLRGVLTEAGPCS